MRDNGSVRSDVGRLSANKAIAEPGAELVSTVRAGIDLFRVATNRTVQVPYPENLLDSSHIPIR